MFQYRDHNEHFRFGSAGFASHEDMANAGLHTQSPSAFFMGFDPASSKPLWYHGNGGGVLVAGARSGKLRDILGYNLCSGILSGESLLILDPKGELYCVSQNQTADQKHVAAWNPSGMHGVKGARLNPTSYLKWNSPTLRSDLKVFLRNFAPLSGSPQAEYFELGRMRWKEAICLTLIKKHHVLRLSDLYQIIQLLPGNSESWLDFAFEMHTSGISEAISVETEIAAGRADSAGGFLGIMGEVLKSVSCLSDTALLDSVSPHPDGSYDFDLADLCNITRFWQFYMMCPAEFVEIWSPVLRSIFTGAMVFKSRAPHAPRQSWILDEVAQLGKFPLIPQLLTYGAGIGIRAFLVYQTIEQMNRTAMNGQSIILSSAALQIYFAIRELPSSRTLSDMLGAQTLEYDNIVEQGRASVRKQRVLHAVIMGGDPFIAGKDFAQSGSEIIHRTKQRRMLRTPDEILKLGEDEQIIFCDGVSKPILGKRAPYYEQPFMAGRYFPNPYYTPLNRVKVRTKHGYRWRKVITERVPRKFQDYPQYADGTWSRLK